MLIVYQGSIHSSEPENYFETSASGGPGGSDRNGGNFGGRDRPDNDDNDEGDYAGAWVVLFLAGIPYAIDGARRLSFGKDGIRILNLPAEPGMHKVSQESGCFVIGFQDVLLSKR